MPPVAPVPALGKTVVAACGPGQRARHLFAPCLHVHSGGHLLMVCRWDEHGADEGDATNEQALFFSRDDGASWTLAGDRPILTCANGSSFPAPSSITHAWIFENRAGRTWLYYTINQPFTWGEDRPQRSTGGGEIRQQEIVWDGADWRTRGPSEIVWGFQQPLPDGRGGIARDIRVVAWNGCARLRDGALVMPIGGRASVAAPRGAFAKLDRVWVLVSRDDGRTWPEAHFVGGGDALCLAEPTLVETATPGELVCLCRVQYGTGDQLQRVMSRDSGRTWSAPTPTGLPQAGAQGVKPHLLRRAAGGYALIQTNEHEVIERTNIAVFLTDEAGLATDAWPRLRTLHIGNRRGWWPGSCYGWLAEAPDGALLAAWPCHDPAGGKLLFTRLDPAALEQAEPLEPNGVSDEWGDHVPRRDGPPAPDGEASFVFRNVRGRLVAPDFGAHRQAGARLVSLALRVAAPPATGEFRALRFTARNGRDEICALLLSRTGWAARTGGAAFPLAAPLPEPAVWLDLQVAIAAGQLTLRLGRDSFAIPIASAPTGLQIGGTAEPAACAIFVGAFSVSS